MRRLLIDLDVCSKCEDCGMVCSYIQHPRNNGITSIREFAHFAVICRKCDDEPCVASCPWDALEKQDDRVLARYVMRCTSCKSCSSGCPFGTIFPETIPYIAARCDFCIGRLKNDEHPVCLESCPHGGIKYGEFAENKEEGVYQVSQNLLAKTSQKWERVEATPVRKK
jgi:Fe-S-cluster-containing dehydrogenase component